MRRSVSTRSAPAIKSTMRRTIWAAGGILALAFFAPFETPSGRIINQALAADAQSTPAFSGGTFRRTDPSPSTLMIVKRGANWRMALTGGGIPRGENSAADCSLLAEGQLNNGQIQAKIIPFKNDDMEIDADMLKDNPGVVVVKLAPTGVVVTQATVDPFCGVGSMLTGTYRKVR